eukprot:m.132898 g.132898  ORF g.132898 m.132898 type:complete len:407 (+) comp14656_c0_seq1:362-1582(+)
MSVTNGIASSLARVPASFLSLFLGYTALGRTYKLAGKAIPAHHMRMLDHTFTDFDYANISFALMGCLALLIYVIKLFVVPQQVFNDFKTLESSIAFCAFSMAIIIHSENMLEYISLTASQIVWWLGVGLHVVFMVNFICLVFPRKTMPFNWQLVSGAYFVPFVGICVCIPAAMPLGKEIIMAAFVIFLFGCLSLACVTVLNIVSVYKLKTEENFLSEASSWYTSKLSRGYVSPQHRRLGAVGVCMAPAALCMMGAMAFEEKKGNFYLEGTSRPFQIGVIAGLTVCYAIGVLVVLWFGRRLILFILRSRFTPYYGYLTFPSDACASGAFVAAEYFDSHCLLIVSYVLLGFATFFNVAALVRHVHFLRIRESQEKMDEASPLLNNDTQSAEQDSNTLVEQPTVLNIQR